MGDYKAIIQNEKLDEAEQNEWQSVGGQFFWKRNSQNNRFELTTGRSSLALSLKKDI